MKSQRLTNLLLGIIAVCLVLLVADNYTDEPAHAQFDTTKVKVENSSLHPIPVFISDGTGSRTSLGRLSNPLHVKVTNFPE